MDEIAKTYVQLALAVGQHDEGYIDAYYGPAEWADQAKTNNTPLNDILRQLADLSAQLSAMKDSYNAREDELVFLRYMYLVKQVQAMATHVRRLQGEVFSFVKEAELLYDVTPIIHNEEYFSVVLKELEGLLSALQDTRKKEEAQETETEAVWQKYARFRKAFVIPTNKLDSVFQAAITECRKRSTAHIQLGSNENFKVEYVNNKAWSAYNWYKGNNYSIIQVNTDLPIYIDRAVDLAAHEGYPGHHVYNALLEEHLVKGRKWVEFSVYPLFSHQSLIAEGTANYGIEVAFPGEERVFFEKEVLFPLAGIDPSLAVKYYEVERVVAKLAHAGNMAAQKYLDGQIDKDKAIQLLTEYALMEPDRAKQRIKFIEKYRSYVINYNIGKDMVRDYIEAKVHNDSEKRWAEFGKLLSSPRLPSGLVVNKN